nr:hypothetical protein [Streptomyces fodineus]
MAVDEPYYSPKHRHHGMKVQVLAVEDLGVVDDDAVEEPVELLGVDGWERSTLPFSRGVRGLM